MPLVKMPESRDEQVAPSGLRPLDRLLPCGGVPRGSLVDWLCDDDVSGGVALACAVAASLAGGGGTLVVVDRGGRFQQPSLHRPPRQPDGHDARHAAPRWETAACGASACQ